MATGSPRSFHKKYSFEVQWKNPVNGVFELAEFQTCSELSSEIAKIEHFEGGNMRPYKEPGRVTFTDITLERGASNDDALFKWYTQIITSSALSGNPLPKFCRDVDIVQLERDRSEIRRWKVLGAWPVKYTAGDWDNNSDDNVIEAITLTYDYFELDQSAVGTILQLAGTP